MTNNNRKKRYVPGASVKEARDAYQAKAAQKPGAYTSRYQNGMEDTLGKIMNREDFSYDVNGDALYAQYRDHYTRMGRLAMEDTVGQAAALTGGYGNSYAQTAGQQMYGNYLQQLNDKIPELYALALEQYQAEGDALYDQYALLHSQEAEDYSRYKDALNSYQTDLDSLYEAYLQERDFDYGAYADELEYHYRADRDAAADAQWEKEHSRWLAEFEESKRQYEQSMALQQSQSENKKTLEAAQLLADAGDYSLLAQYYGLTPEQLATLQGENIRYVYLDEENTDEEEKRRDKPPLPPALKPARSGVPTRSKILSKSMV